MYHKRLCTIRWMTFTIQVSVMHYAAVLPIQAPNIHLNFDSFGHIFAMFTFGEKLSSNTANKSSYIKLQISGHRTAGVPSKHEMLLQYWLQSMSPKIISNLPVHMRREPMLVQCWASVADSGLVIPQHWINVSCSLDVSYTCLLSTEAPKVR